MLTAIHAITRLTSEDDDGNSNKRRYPKSRIAYPDVLIQKNFSTPQYFCHAITRDYLL